MFKGSFPYRIAKAAGKAIDRLWLLLCLIFFGTSVYSMADILHLDAYAQDKTILQYKPNIETGETDAYADLTGYTAWLTVNDTTIDYPVMQGADNNEYLNKDPYGQFSLSGSIFLDSRNSPDYTDEYNIVYGHHMEKSITGSSLMFGALDDFYNLDYFKSHRDAELIVDKDIYKMKVFAIADVPANSVVFNTEIPVGELIAYLRDNAVLFGEPDGNTILALATCKSYQTDERIILFCTYDVDRGNNGSPPKKDDEDNTIHIINEKTDIPTGSGINIVIPAVIGLTAGIILIMIQKNVE